ncbi:MAG: RNA polymerase sigma factor FliA [Gammaproteobacteria bacterium]
MSALAAYAIRDDSPEQLISRYAALVNRIAHHLLARLPAAVQIDDLIQAGMLGLIEATRRYDARRGANFATFAEHRIRGAMLDEIRKGDWTPRSVHRKAREVSTAIRAVEAANGGEATDREVAAQLGITLAEYHKTLADMRGQKLLSIEELGAADDDDEREGADGLVSPAIGPAETVQREQLQALLALAIERLPEREKLALSLYYDEGLNLKEIGLVLGVSESRVSQLHSQALARLRARMSR